MRHFNGLITNDKFCMSRPARLKLQFSRYAVYLQRKARQDEGYAPQHHATCGGSHASTVADLPTSQPASGCSATLGPSLSTAAAVDSTDRRRKRTPNPTLDSTTGGV